LSASAAWRTSASACGAKLIEARASAAAASVVAVEGRRMVKLLSGR
jgi:hypothetical protein